MRLLYEDYGQSLLSGFAYEHTLAMQDDTGLFMSALNQAKEIHPNIYELGVETNKVLNWTENVGLDFMFNKTMDISGASEGIFRLAAGLDKIPLNTNLAGLWHSNPTLYNEIVEHVDKFLFNYRRLTPVESVIFRRVIPFYAWNKNIARLAITLPFEDPLRFHIIRYLGATMEDAYWSSIAEEKGWDLSGEEAQNLIPKYMRERYRLPKGLVPFAKKMGFTDTDNDLWISLMGANPFADVPIDLSSILSKIDPIIASGIEYATSVSLWKQRPYLTPYEETEKGIEKVKPSFLQIYGQKFPQVQLAINLIKGAGYNIQGQVYTDKYGRPVYKKNRWAELVKMAGINLSQMDLDQIWSDEMERQKKARKTMEKMEKEQKLYKEKHGLGASIKKIFEKPTIDAGNIGNVDLQKLFLYGED
jgi:hypothetical protein